MLPGNQIFAKEKCKSFEEATDLAIESLRKQIEKHKQKKTAAAESAKKAVAVKEGNLTGKKSELEAARHAGMTIHLEFGGLQELVWV